MKKISFSYKDKRGSMRCLGEWEVTEVKLTLVVPFWFGKSIIQLIKNKVKELR